MKNRINGVEIFGVGNHNGDDYTAEDLADMAEAFAALDYKPALKLGHTKDSPGELAFGWVENLRVVGTKLLADFVDINEKVFEAVRARSFDRVSAEIFFNLKRGGKVFKKALKAVALLGAEIPAVAGLKPLHQMQFEHEGFQLVRSFEAKLDVTIDKEDEMELKEIEAKIAKEVAEKTAALAASNKELADKLAELSKDDTATKALAASNARILELEEQNSKTMIAGKVAAIKIPALRPAMEGLYTLAAKHDGEKIKTFGADKKEVELSPVAVVDSMAEVINEQAAKLFADLATTGEGARKDAQDENAGVEVDKRIQKYRAEHPEVKTYEEAMKAVLSVDAELNAKYQTQQAN